MKFIEFVQLFTDLNSPLGDFTRDIMSDNFFESSVTATEAEEHFDLVLTDNDQRRMASALVELSRYV